MKNYKNLVPIILVVLFLLGIYMKVDQNLGMKEEYNAYLDEARAYREKQIAVDAETNYLAAIDVYPSVELYVEVGEFYYELVSNRKAMEWGEDLVELYPEDSLGYEFILRVYKEIGRYEDFFDMYSTVCKRGLETETIAGYANELSNVYKLEGDYEDVGYFAGGYCKVMDDELWAYVNIKGSEITKYNFTYAGNFSDDVAPIINKIGELYLIDNEGNKKYIIENIDNVVEIGCYSDELCTIFDGSTWGIYTLDGELKYGGYEDVSTLANGVIAVQQNGKWTLLDNDGNQLISESFDNIKQDEKGIVYRNSRLFVEQGGKYYMMDKEGNKIVDTAFQDVKIFNGDGYAAVKIKGKWGFIDQAGEIVIEPKYEDARSFANGYAAVKDGDLWGFINEKDELFIDYKFTDVRDFTSSGSVFVKQATWRLLRLYSYN